MAEQPIKYSDLISPDDSIEKLIQQLEQLNETYTNMANGIKQQAQKVSASLKSVSGATEQGRKETKDASDEANRLQKAYKQLDAALSENGKQINWLNSLKREAVKYDNLLKQRGKEEIRTMQQIKEASYQQLSAQYSLNKAYINSLTATDRRIAKNKELIKSTKEIYEQMKKLQADTGKMQLNVGNYPQLGGLMSTLGMATVGIGSMTAAGMAAVGVLKSNIETARNYEKALSGLAAILNTTKDGVQDLSEQALHLGATTVFTASEVVQLQTELAKLGYTTKDIMNMAPSVLSFAQATGSGLADAASLAGAALRMFEQDTTHTTEFVDKMTASTTKSALNFSYLQNALSTVSPVANAFGFKIEEVLALLGQLANAGFDASSAATATRNIILKLADANGDLAKALGEPVTDLDTLVKGLETLRDKGIDLSEALELTDKRSVAAFNTFLSGTDTVRKLHQELSNCDGAAKKMAETMGDNLDGAIKGLSSAWEGFNLHLNQSNGLLTTMVRWLTQVIRLIDSATQKLESMFGAMGVDMSSYVLQKVREARDNYLNGAPSEVGDFTIYDPNDKTLQSAGGGGKTKKKGKGSSKSATDKALKEQEKAQKQSLELRRKYEDAMVEMMDDEFQRERAKILLSYNRKIEDLQAQLAKEKNLTTKDRENINKTIEALEQAKYVKLADSFDKYAKKISDKEKKDAQEKERNRKQTLKDSEKVIELQHKIDLAEIDSIEASEREKTRMRLEAEKERLKKLLALYEQDGKILSAKEVELLKKQIKIIEKEINDNKSRDIYDLLGFNLSDEKKEAINTTLEYAMSAVNQYMDAWVEAANRKVELADKEVDAAKSVLEAEIEARNQGYANNVEMAQKELEAAKKNQEKALKEQASAQRAQELINSAEQVSNLITASSLIWRQLGFPWAIPALAVMWGSFAAAKVKAMDAAKVSSETYGEGTVELLEGGSHQSGNDIDLGRKKDGTRRRAEGGEFFAVINKRSSRRYRNIIPDVVHSLNDGTFADKYMQAFPAVGGTVVVNHNTDLRELQDDVREIRKQGSRRVYIDQDGNVIEEYKNVKRKIMKS